MSSSFFFVLLRSSSGSGRRGGDVEGRGCPSRLLSLLGGIGSRRRSTEVGDDEEVGGDGGDSLSIGKMVAKTLSFSLPKASLI